MNSIRVQKFDYIIIGAGPAGMAAAITARAHGLSVLVLDEQTSAGGQIFRNIETLEATRKSEFSKLGQEYESGSSLVRRFKKCGADYFPDRSVWQIDNKLQIHHVSASSSKSNSVISHCQAKRLLIAVGAMERPMPLPGWTIPGVMPCTAADVLYKSSGFIPDGEVVLAGSGPLLLLIGCRLLDVGVHVSAFLDTSMNGALLKALPLLPNALRSHKYLTRGLSLLWKIRKAGIPIYSGIQNIEALGSSKLEKVRISKSGKFFDVKADLLLLHNGVVPNVQITRNLGCEHRWYDVQRYWEPVVDDWGNTSVGDVSIAGDCGRVAGAAISEVSGHLAALETVCQLGVISQAERDKLSQPHRIELARHNHVRPFLDKLFQPAKKWLIPEDEKTLACRCEEVKVSEIRETVRMGIKDPDRLKSMTRCGMGYCQARMCGLTVSEIIAEENKVSPEEIGYFRVRSPIRPVTLGQVAEID